MSSFAFCLAGHSIFTLIKKLATQSGFPRSSAQIRFQLISVRCGISSNESYQELDFFSKNCFLIKNLIFCCAVLNRSTVNSSSRQLWNCIRTELEVFRLRSPKHFSSFRARNTGIRTRTHLCTRRRFRHRHFVQRLHLVVPEDLEDHRMVLDVLDEAFRHRYRDLEKIVKLYQSCFYQGSML